MKSVERCRKVKINLEEVICDGSEMEISLITL
jgi:hypothetical protein